MPHGDDLDARFNEVVAQIGEDERRRMRSAAAKAAKEGATRQRAPGGPGGPGPRGSRPGRPPADRAPRRLGRSSVVLIMLCALVGAAGIMITYRPDLLGANPGLEGVPVLADPVPAADPFAGSPAEKYADGAAGFVMPEAKALGGLSKADVAGGLKRTRALLAAALLDRKTLLGGRPTAFARLLDPGQRERFYEELGGKPYDSRYMVTSFAPRSADLATDVIKVNGAARLDTFREGGRHGVKIDVNYLVAYAVRRPGAPSTTMRLVAHLSGEVQLYRSGGRTALFVNWSMSPTPASCDTHDGFIHPVYADDPPGTVTATGPPIDPYDLADRPRSGEGCDTAQGT
ncbi:hypothetical protein ACIBIZ_26825 [Nonomuraea spiralis]|uniref:hypothetical protein n=1 Tax=Nonomuraea TaxID=83681 RepID=UPI000F7A2CA2|nr:hypothetical protein [Nonomuraea sp. WAC 01424]